VIENMDLERFGFFEFAPEAAVDRGLLGSLLAAAVEETGRVDAVIFPEDAVHADEIAGLEETLDEHGATFLIAGVREPPTARGFGRNYLHFGVRGATGWDRYEQDKHHRWCLDEGQLRQYRLTRLLDGPQLAGRWPCRYASILADEPGAAVLTLTSYGMVGRSRPPGKRPSRVVAHWNNRLDGLHEIELAPRAAAVLVSASVEDQTLGRPTAVATATSRDCGSRAYDSSACRSGRAVPRRPCRHERASRAGRAVRTHPATCPLPLLHHPDLVP
jgi:hypothetical protein